MIMAQEQAILKAQEQFAQIQDFLRQACVAGRQIDQVELDLWGRMLQLGRQLLEGYVAGYRQGDLGPTLTQDGRVLRRLEQPHVRRYVSIFGPIPISRYVYGTRETQKHEVIPLDALLALPDSEFSYVLQDWDQMLARGLVQGPAGAEGPAKRHHVAHVETVQGRNDVARGADGVDECALVAVQGAERKRRFFETGQAQHIELARPTAQGSGAV